jgi:hypothetical protein
MDVEVIKTVAGKQYNRFNEQLVACQKACGRLTTMTGTRLCDFCWESEREDQRKNSNAQHSH